VRRSDDLEDSTQSQTLYFRKHENHFSDAVTRRGNKKKKYRKLFEFPKTREHKTSGKKLHEFTVGTEQGLNMHGEGKNIFLIEFETSGM
jgi:hypothetical protein